MTTNKPVDTKLYEKVKKEIYAKHPKHSAYRSGLLVQEYKRRGGRYSGKESEKTGLNRWFAEAWRSQDGSVGYKRKGDIYRPTRRVTSETPKTFKELSKQDIEKARREKAKTGRVKKF